MKILVTTALVMALIGCTLAPQKLRVMPELSFDNLQGVKVPIELVIEDNRGNDSLLGYRNAKKEGAIKFDGSLVKSLGESIQKAFLRQGVKMHRGPEPMVKLSVEIEKLNYSTPDKSWVSHIAMEGEILLTLSRAGASFKKRFSGNRSQDVATAPSVEFNENYMNALLSELVNKAMNDREVIDFLK
jgi:uncharacterized lipoprotein YajG